MRFEVLDRDGVVKASMTDRRSIYPPGTLKQLAAAGYTFRLNGKRWKPGQPITTGTQKATTQPRSKKTK